MIRKRGQHWHMDVSINGVRYREPLRTTDKREAKEAEKRRVAEILAGKGSSLAGREFARLPFTTALEQLMEERKPHVAPKTQEVDKNRSKPLCRYFGDRPLNRITAADIATFQRKRLAGEGFDVAGSARTINMEVTLLRTLMQKAKLWGRLREDVKALPESSAPIGRALTVEELRHLFAVSTQSERWLVVRCAMTIALATAGRGVELKGLRWQHVDLFSRMLRFERSKTSGGIRTIPLTGDAVNALTALRARAEAFGPVEDEHFIFATCENLQFDPTKPMKGWRTAWRSLVAEAATLAGDAAERAGESRATAEKPFRGLRFHDLRHCSVTMLAEAGVSDATLMSISGHLSRKMLEHYSHVRIQAKRDAVTHLPSGLFSMGAEREAETTGKVQ
ncbi:MAG: site-specific integrase [Acidobacteriaceae bacterium]|jgi:integrase|nr:site-specific integrase [Acidobacteriaceae bacterium]